ncbi:MAG: toll/interleukin-1 receptor domain-containing protein, partial [Methanosarcinaceae archaeon]|nr:toll/interleukin-1 receptor domain-containing protein [Methanosarcinaceae archaeon]
RSIDKGLAESSYGLVIISTHFIKKRWTEYELRGLVAREMSEDRVILPIWHDITYEDLVKYSPTLADRLATKSSFGLKQVVSDLLDAMEIKA